jgi:hypothetical protein
MSILLSYACGGSGTFGRIKVSLNILVQFELRMALLFMLAHHS